MWTAKTFKIADENNGVREVYGLASDHLGLHQPFDEYWSLTHLNSGHAICHLMGVLGDIIPYADMVEKTADWSFRGLTDWKSADPTLGARMGKLIADNPNVFFVHGKTRHPQGEEYATKIADERASERSRP